MLSVVVAAAVIVAADPGTGIPGFDPQLERVLVSSSTKTLPAPSQSRGSFVIDGGVAVQAFAPWGETGFLLPHVVDNGVVTENTGDWSAIELTSHRTITIQVGTDIAEVPNVTWSGL